MVSIVPKERTAMAAVFTSDRGFARNQPPSMTRPRPSSAIRVWAAIGGVILAFQT